MNIRKQQLLEILNNKFKNNIFLLNILIIDLHVDFKKKEIYPSKITSEILFSDMMNNLEVVLKNNPFIHRYNINTLKDLNELINILSEFYDLYAEVNKTCGHTCDYILNSELSFQNKYLKYKKKYIQYKNNKKL